MLQLVQSLRSGDVEVLEVPDAIAPGKHVLVRTEWSVISPGTEQAIARTASKSLVGKALDRPDQVRQVLDKVARDGIASTVAAVGARLDDLLTPGYSCAGTVVATGPGVTQFRTGDRVACVGANLACHAELVSVPEPLTFRLPEELSTRHGAFAALGAIAGHGVRLSGAAAGEVVAVVGLGLIGQLAAQMATAAGARVVGVDTNTQRVDLAVRLGASGGLVLGRDDPQAVIQDASDGHGADVVIVAAASKDSGPIQLAGELARDRGVVCVVGDVGLDVPRRTYYEKELVLRVSRSYGPGRYDNAYEVEGRDYPIGYVRWTEGRLISYFLRAVATGRVDLEPLVSHEFPLGEGVAAYAALDDPKRMAILLQYEPERGPRDAPAPPALAPAPTGGELRVGLVGPGLFARSTLLPLLERSGARLTVVGGGSGPRAAGAARRHAGTRAVAGADEVYAADDVDAVVIATRHDSHAELAARALESGKAVFLEKPLAIDEAALARVAGLMPQGRLVVDFNRRFAPATRTVVAALEGREDPIHVAVRVNAGALPADHWLRDPAVGGGRLVGEGCHFVDLCRAIVGEPVVELQVVALPPGRRTLAEDSFQLTLSHRDGSISTIAYLATGSARMRKERVEVIGAGRSFVIDDFRAVRQYSRWSVPAPAISQDKGHAQALAAALTFFLEGGSAPIPYAELLETTRVTLAAREALRNGARGPVALGEG